MKNKLFLYVFICLAAVALGSAYYAGYISKPNISAECKTLQQNADAINLAGPVVNNFSFLSVEKTDGLKAFADKHFPVGTSRRYIESILVDQGNAKVTNRLDLPAPRLSTVGYRYYFGGAGDCSSGIQFVFNQRNETVYQSFALKPGLVKYRPFTIVGGCTGL
jgi:hypothetical protein